MSATTKIEWTDATLKFGAMTPPALMCSSKPMRFTIGFDPFYAEKDASIDYFFALMALASQHRFLVLTKNSRRMRQYLSRNRPGQNGVPMPPLWHIGMTMGQPDWNDTKDWPLPNVWIGVSIEDQHTADERIPDLLATPAAVRWVSAEPLLGAIKLTRLQQSDGSEIDSLFGSIWCPGAGSINSTTFRGRTRLNWVVVGGESGKGARPMHPNWVRTIRDQCAAAGVPFFFKQWGNKAAGRLLDGVTHDAYPERRT